MLYPCSVTTTGSIPQLIISSCVSHSPLQQHAAAKGCFTVPFQPAIVLCVQYAPSPNLHPGVQYPFHFSSFLSWVLWSSFLSSFPFISFPFLWFIFLSYFFFPLNVLSFLSLTYLSFPSFSPNFFLYPFRTIFLSFFPLPSIHYLILSCCSFCDLWCEQNHCLILETLTFRFTWKCMKISTRLCEIVLFVNSRTISVKVRNNVQFPCFILFL